MALQTEGTQPGAALNFVCQSNVPSSRQGIARISVDSLELSRWASACCSLETQGQVAAVRTLFEKSGEILQDKQTGSTGGEETSSVPDTVFSSTNAAAAEASAGNGNSEESALTEEQQLLQSAVVAAPACRYLRPGLLDLDQRQCLQEFFGDPDLTRASFAFDGDLSEEEFVRHEFTDLLLSGQPTTQLRYRPGGTWPRLVCSTNRQHAISPFLSTQNLLRWQQQCCADGGSEVADMIFAIKTCVPTTIFSEGEEKLRALQHDAVVQLLAQEDDVAREERSSRQRCTQDAFDVPSYNCSEFLPASLPLQPMPTALRLSSDQQTPLHVYVPSVYLPRAIHASETFTPDLYQHLAPLVTDARARDLAAVGAASRAANANAPDTFSTFYFGFVPGVFRQLGQVPGNDNITGGIGNDTLVGDVFVLGAEALVEGAADSLRKEVEHVLGNVRLRLSVLSRDTNTWEDQVVEDERKRKLFLVGNDRLEGGEGVDLIR